LYSAFQTKKSEFIVPSSNCTIAAPFTIVAPKVAAEREWLSHLTGVGPPLCCGGRGGPANGLPSFDCPHPRKREHKVPTAARKNLNLAPWTLSTNLPDVGVDGKSDD
jgi:hypothetical protein